jgi:glutamine amidotransferase
MKRPKVTVIDYGMGNIWSVLSALNYLGCDGIVTAEASQIANAERLILPGVGSFRRAMESIKQKDLENAIVEAALVKKVNFLGICLGMQLMSTASTEDGETKGLKMIPTTVARFSQEEVEGRKIPHVGFDQVLANQNSTLFRGIAESPEFYFVHSYRMENSNLPGIASTCQYGIDFLAAYEHENLFATQFHPEKSQANGLLLLRNFLRA